MVLEDGRLSEAEPLLTRKKARSIEKLTQGRQRFFHSEVVRPI